MGEVGKVCQLRLVPTSLGHGAVPQLGGNPGRDHEKLRGIYGFKKRATIIKGCAIEVRVDWSPKSTSHLTAQILVENTKLTSK